MAVVTDPFVAADLQYTLPTILADYINRGTFPKAIAANFFTDLSYLTTEGGRVITVPDVYTNQFTVSTQSVQGAEITTQGPAQASNTLTLNTHKYIAFIIGDADLVQIASKYQLLTVYAEESAKLLIRGLEDAIFALIPSLTNNVGTTTTNVTDQSIRDAITLLDGADYDITNGNAAFFFHPKVFWGQLGSIVKYYSNNISQFNYLRTGNFGPFDASRGLKGVLYDIPVFTSSRLPDSATVAQGMLASKMAIGFAIQNGGQGNDGVQDGQMTVANRVRTQMEYQLRNLGMLCVVDMIFGVALLRPAAAVWIKSNDTSAA